MTRPTPAAPTTGRPARAIRRVPPRWRKGLLTVHVFTSVSLAGAALALLTLGIAGVLGADPRAVYPAAHLVEARLLVPLAVLSLAIGVLLAALSPYGLARYQWVPIKMVTTAALTGVAIFVLSPRLAAAADAAMGGQAVAAARRLPLVLGPAVAVVLLALNATLGVYKPGRRVR